MDDKVLSEDANKRIKSLENKLRKYEKKIGELKREKKMLGSLIRYSSLGIVTVDENIVIKSCNAVFEDLFQYRESEIVGKDLDEVIAKGHSVKDAKGYSRKTLMGKPVSGVERRYRKDGTSFYVEFFAVPAIVDGKVVGAYGIYQDVSERVEMKKRLEESEERLKRVFQASPLGMGLFKDRIMQWHNDAMSKMLGYKSEEIIGKDARMIYPNDREYHRAGESIALLDHGRETTSVETKWVRKNGQIFDCHVWYSLLDFRHGDRVVLAIAEDVTERKKIGKRLRESEARYGQLVELSPLAIAVYDDRNMYFANSAALKMLGVESDRDFLGKTLKDFVHPDSMTLVKKRYKRFIGGESLPSAYEKLVTMKGDIIEVGAYSSPVSFKGKPAIMSVFLDVTEKRKAEAKLQEEEERYRKLYEDSKRQEGLYRSLLNSSADAIVIYNLQGEAEFISPSFTKTFGWTFEEVKGKRIPFVPEIEKENTMNVITELLESGKPVHGFETRRLTKDGRILDISISASRYSDHKDNPAGILVVLRDITDRVQAEKQVRESERRFRDLFNSVSDLIFTMDLKGRFLSANKAVYEIVGYTPEELIDRRPSDNMKPELRDLFDKEYLVDIREKGYHHGISAYLAKDGRKIYIEHRSTLVRPEGSEPYISGIARDVTDRILAERQIKTLREQVHQAQKMEAIGTLAGGIAHDFNNILMGIQGNASLMKHHIKADSPNYERLNNIEEYVQNGSELTMQLLGFARGGKYEAVPTRMNDLIEREAKLFGRAKKEIEIHKNFQDDLWAVEVDQGQMRQVFLNLFLNAWQAMPEGGHLYLQTVNVDLVKNEADLLSLQPGKYVKIVVSDTGVGMDEEVQKRIFEPFFSTKEKGRGTGLGLASVYGIIKNHNGAIEVESQVGSGMTFTLYLPATEKEARETGEETPEEIVIGKGRILLVDDEAKILEVGEQLISMLGYEVTATSSGTEAIEIFRREKGGFDLVILDMIMPEMGGQEVFNVLREINTNVNVLLASGYSINGEASKIIAQGCNGFIQKPFSMVKLSKKISEIIGS